MVERGSQPSFLSSGYLLYALDRQLVAVSFDPDQLTTTGGAVPVGDEIRTDGLDPGRAGIMLQMTVSRTGTVAYVPPPPGGARLGIVDRDGGFAAFGPELADPRRAMLRVSPNGQMLAFGDGGGTTADIYLHDLVRGSTERLTQVGFNEGPVCHPNGRALAMWSSFRQDGSGVYLRDLDGTEELLLPEQGGVARNLSWSPDGSALAYTVQSGSQYDIWVASPDEPTSARPWIEGPAAEYSPRFSPDGRWLAYVSDESGQLEVYVRRYPAGERLRVSTEGGLGAVWSPDGTELFFQGGTLGGGVGDFMTSFRTSSRSSARESRRIDAPVAFRAAEVPGYLTGVHAITGLSSDLAPRGPVLPAFSSPPRSACCMHL